jgi:hypothetical protein
MTRSRWLLIVLVLVALALWAALFVLDLRPHFTAFVPRPPFAFSSPGELEQPLSGLPVWATSLGLFLTLYLAGLASFYVFPDRVRVMRRALTGSLPRLLQIALLGLGFGLVLIAFAIGAVLARVTFPLTILAALSFFFLSVWGQLSIAYTIGYRLLTRAGWLRSSPAAGLALGLLLTLPLTRIPFAGGLFMLIFFSLGLGIVIATRFGSAEPWNLIPLLEEDKE